NIKTKHIKHLLKSAGIAILSNDKILKVLKFRERKQTFKIFNFVHYSKFLGPFELLPLQGDRVRSRRRSPFVKKIANIYMINFKFLIGEIWVEIFYYYGSSFLLVYLNYNHSL
ncbi:hypothetical protein L9F63_019799, partial [Diploptera punctata]